MTKSATRPVRSGGATRPPGHPGQPPLLFTGRGVAGGHPPATGELEGGLSAGAYTATVAATIGSLGGASPATVPAAVATTMVDVAFISQLQLRLAYDVSVLYRVPIDVHDPEDLWKLIRVAFTIKSGEAANKTVVKAVPMVVRPLVKKFCSGTVLNAGRALPVVGRHLLQRNVIKIGIPLIGVPLAVLLNRYTTLVAGRHARAVFRNEARIIELAEGLSERSRHPELMLWVAWLVLRANAKPAIADHEALLMRHLVRTVRERHGVADERLAQVVDIDSADVWKRVADETGDLSDVLDAAERVAAVDGDLDSSEKALSAQSTCPLHRHAPNRSVGAQETCILRRTAERPYRPGR